MDQQVGPFELVRCIGKGATASVFLAYEPIWRKDVAIKRLKHSENSKRLIAHEVRDSRGPLRLLPCPPTCTTVPAPTVPAGPAEVSRIRRRAIACLNALLVTAHPG
jgi:hypothetical protein